MIRNKELDSLDLLFNKGVEGGGITIQNGQEVRLTEGYQVSSNIETKFGYLHRKEAREFFKDIMKMVAPDQYIGIYVSGNYETIYIEDSFHIKDKDEAIKLGVKYKQESIYDWANDDLIWLRYCSVTGEYMTEGFYDEESGKYYKDEEALESEWDEYDVAVAMDQGVLYWTSWEE
jgi:hypothetical protein